ncbi:MAG TPA: metallophosphoesterase family protein [Candidatus Limnocylindria bacterium]|nr:metallophosphoesterase family protein [Candidatus Limnocylindria bacterium]
MRVGLLSDIHANLVALEAVLSALGKVDALWVTGDTVGYGPDPADTLALLRERGAVLVQGNHDRAVATGEGLDFFHDRAAEAARTHQKWLSAADRDALGALPAVVTAERFTLCHGSLRDPLWEYVTTTRAAAATLQLARTDHCCNGHTHIPAVFHLAGEGATAVHAAEATAHRLDGRTLINAGSVGQPRDGDPRASYVLLDTEAGTATFYRASYRIDETQRRIRARGLPEMFADRLAFGV